jgi:hypothetical protein
LQFHHTRLGEFRRRKSDFMAEARRVFGNGGARSAAAADVALLGEAAAFCAVNM